MTGSRTFRSGWGNGLIRNEKEVRRSSQGGGRPKGTTTLDQSTGRGDEVTSTTGVECVVVRDGVGLINRHSRDFCPVTRCKGQGRGTRLSYDRRFTCKYLQTVHLYTTFLLETRDISDQTVVLYPIPLLLSWIVC